MRTKYRICGNESSSVLFWGQFRQRCKDVSNLFLEDWLQFDQDSKIQFEMGQTCDFSFNQVPKNPLQGFRYQKQTSMTSNLRNLTNFVLAF